MAGRLLFTKPFFHCLTYPLNDRGTRIIPLGNHESAHSISMSTVHGPGVLGCRPSDGIVIPRANLLARR